METEKKEVAVENCRKKMKDICQKCKKFLPQIIGALIIIIIAGGVWYYQIIWKKSHLSPKEAQAQVDDFINNNLMQPGIKADIEKVEKENGLYKITLKIGEGNQAQEVVSYLTVDGKKFFPSEPMDIEEVKKQIKEAKEKEAEPENISKSVKPKIDLYVMSFCPYGNQAEDTIKPVYDLLKNKADFNFHYIVSSNGDTVKSLHGEKEVAQNEREACVLKNYGKDKWMSFVTYVNKNCGNDGSCWEAGAKSLAISVAKINTCVNSSGKNLMKEDEKASTAAGASGSPTLVINGTQTKAVYQYGNSEAYKQAICLAFEAAPEECGKVLSAETSTSAGGSCN